MVKDEKLFILGCFANRRVLFAESARKHFKTNDKIWLRMVFFEFPVLFSYFVALATVTYLNIYLMKGPQTVSSTLLVRHQCWIRQLDSESSI